METEKKKNPNLVKLDRVSRKAFRKKATTKEGFQCYAKALGHGWLHCLRFCTTCSEECNTQQCQVGKSLELYAKVSELNLESKSGVSP